MRGRDSLTSSSELTSNESLKAQTAKIQQLDSSDSSKEEKINTFDKALKKSYDLYNQHNKNDTPKNCCKICKMISTLLKINKSGLWCNIYGSKFQDNKHKVLSQYLHEEINNNLLQGGLKSQIKKARLALELASTLKFGNKVKNLKREEDRGRGNVELKEPFKRILEPIKGISSQVILLDNEVVNLEKKIKQVSQKQRGFKAEQEQENDKHQRKNKNFNKSPTKEIVEQQYKSSWSQQEHSKYIRGLRKYGKNWKKITDYIGSKSYMQVAAHTAGFKLKIKKYPKTEGADLIKILKGPLSKD